MTSTSEDKVAELLPALREELGDLAEGVHDYNLIKFLRWKPSVERAADRFRALHAWRKDHPFGFDEPPLQASQDDTLKRTLESNVIVAPDGMVDKQGRAVIVVRLRNNDMTDGRTVEDFVRMGIYTLDRILEEREDAQQNGVVVFHDLRGFSFKNGHPAIPRMTLGAILGHFPVKIKGIYLYEAPGFFKAVFIPLVYLFMPTKVQERIHFVKSLDELYEVIDQDEMLEEHGGKREHDAIEWVARQMQREADGSMQSLIDRNIV